MISDLILSCVISSVTVDCIALNFLCVSGGSDEIRKVLKPFSVVDVRGPQVFQAVRRAKDVAIEDYMIGRLLLSATDAFGCI